MLNNLLKKIKTLGVLMTASCLISACTNHIDYYKSKEPKLDLQNFLKGKIAGVGLIKDWRGRVTRQFNFVGDATWHKNIGTFQEKMQYEDGQTDHRTWTIKRINNHYYEGTTADVIGIAKIFVEGNAMNWQYKMDVKVDGSTYRLTFDDWMYLMKNDTLINENKFKKLGITVGSLILFMHKAEEK